MSCIIDNCNNFVRVNPLFSTLSLSRLHPPLHLRNPVFISLGAPLKRYRSFSSTQLAVSVDPTDLITLEEQSEELNNKDTVERLLTKRNNVPALNSIGYHGDLTPEESQILLAEFSLRHSRNAISIAQEYAKWKLARPASML